MCEKFCCLRASVIRAVTLPLGKRFALPKCYLKLSHTPHWLVGLSLAQPTQLSTGPCGATEKVESEVELAATAEVSGDNSLFLLTLSPLCLKLRTWGQRSPRKAPVHRATAVLCLSASFITPMLSQSKLQPHKVQRMVS